MKTQIIFTLAVIAITMFACTQAFRTKMKAQNFLETQTTQSQCLGSTLDACKAAGNCPSCIGITDLSSDVLSVRCNPAIYGICTIEPGWCGMDQGEAWNICYNVCGTTQDICGTAGSNYTSCCNEFNAYLA
jgi:hypothetical protein